MHRQLGLAPQGRRDEPPQRHLEAIAVAVLLPGWPPLCIKLHEGPQLCINLHEGHSQCANGCQLAAGGPQLLLKIHRAPH